MSNNRKILGAAAFSLALAGGGAAGAVLGTPILSSAQDGTTSTATPTTDDSHWGRGPDGGAGLTVAAKALGITEAELLTALQGGQSIAEVAEANNVDVQTVIDALVADAKTRLDDAISTLPDRITEMVNQPGLPDGGHRGGPGGHGFMAPGIDEAASTIGVTEAELRTALQGGSSIADVASDNGVEVQTVIDALVKAGSDHLDEEVTEGDLTEAEATTRKAGLESTVTTLVNQKGPLGPTGFRPPADAPTNA